MVRRNHYALASVLLVVTFLLTLPEESSRADAATGRVRRQSPWLHRAPNTFALGKKFVRNRPLSSVAHALETNVADTSGSVEQQPARTPELPAPKRRPTEVPAAEDEESSKPAKPRSRAFYNCMSGCLTLSQYNPVCGSDHTTYHNVYKLECANRCGASPRVSIKKSGIC